MIGLRLPRPASATGPSGHDRAPGERFSRLRLPAPVVQARLAVGDPADPLEREADAMAERVMRSPSPCPACAAHRDDEDTLRRQSRSPFSPDEGQLDEEAAGPAAPLQAKSAGSGDGPVAGPAVSATLRALRGGGDPLPAPVRRFMEPRFGHDFGQVRVHTGRLAEQSARRLQARAFTIGRDVVFGRGEYAPAAAEGRRLIAHELTHVVQQGRAAPLPQPGAAAPAGPLAREDEGTAVRRVAWTPNHATGRRSSPWGAGGPAGQILEAATDAGTPLDIWQPDDGSTYWCHGFTFGGPSARGGPYSIWGQDVPGVLADDGWQPTFSCMAQPADILVFRDAAGHVAHSGIIRSVVSPDSRVDEAASTLESKWGAGSLNTSSWEANATQYGRYTCYSKTPQTGVCNGQGANEG